MIFLENIDFSINQKRLCNSHYEGLITLLPKLNKNKLNPCNYRPITLLNCDYKMLSKVINNMQYPLLTKLIGDDQNGFIKDRNVADNIRLMLIVIDYASNKDLSGAVLSVDLYKAFDSLRRPFIFAMLRRYGFGNLLIKWIKVLYKNPKCRIIKNNFLSPFFQVKVGVRQENPLSPTIFILCIEYLLIMLR